MSYEDYEIKFSNFPSGVLGHCDQEGNIYIKGGSKATISHISTHETMHLCANRGITELYTTREMENRGEQVAAYSVNAYPESQEWARRLEKVVGKEKAAEVCFGRDRESLEQEFAKLNQYDPEA